MNTTQQIAAIEQELSDRYGAKLEPIKAPLNQRGRYARLAKLTEEPYHIKGGRQTTEKIMREKMGNR